MPIFYVYAACALACSITLFILGIHKSFAKEYGYIEAIGLWAGYVPLIIDITKKSDTQIMFSMVFAILLLQIYLGVSFQKHVKLFRYFAPLNWDYGPSQ
jgi:hypothetical protein